MATLPSENSRTGVNSDRHPPDSDGAGLGELLRRARERCGLTIEQVSRETKIPLRHLQALEHDNPTGVPGGFYRRAEILTYARAVKLDQKLALARLGRGAESPAPRKVQTEAPAGTDSPALTGKRALIIVGVLVAAAGLGRAIIGREAARDGEDQGSRAADFPSRPAISQTPAVDVVRTSRPTPVDPAAFPPAASEEAPAAAVVQAPAAAVSQTPAVAAVQSPAPGAVPAVAPPAPATEQQLNPVQQSSARIPGEFVTELVVTTEPAGARVTVNGIGWGTTPVTIRYLPAGDKRIRVSMAGYGAEELTVSLAEGRQRTVGIRLRRPS